MHVRDWKLIQEAHWESLWIWCHHWITCQLYGHSWFHNHCKYSGDIVDAQLHRYIYFLWRAFWNVRWIIQIINISHEWRISTDLHDWWNWKKWIMQNHNVIMYMHMHTDRSLWNKESIIENFYPNQFIHKPCPILFICELLWTCSY